MIDWIRVRELHEEVGNADFEEVATLFIEEVRGALDRLEALDDAAEELHFLKGSALNLGFTALAGHCAAGADAATLRRCFEESAACFRAELPRRLAA